MCKEELKNKMIINLFKNMSDNKMSIEDIINKVDSLLISKNSDYNDPAGLIDIMCMVTKYHKANVPGSEAGSLYRVLVKILRYMNLRSKKDSPNYESLEDTLMDLIGEAIFLYRNYVNNLK